MEPLTLATSFAAIVGLMADFVSSRRGSEAQTIDEYVDWLRRHEHQELADAIANNAELSQSIRKVLVGQHDAVMAKLVDLDKVLTSVASNLTDFTDIAKAVRKDSFLSDQAVSILRQMNAISASRFLEIKTLGGTFFQFMSAPSGQVQTSDPRFIEDDLDTLCNLGLLLLSYNNQGARIFTITREGAKVGG
jgi:hypothetical protein